MIHCCVFSLRSRRFGLPLEAVREMVGAVVPVPVPWSPACLLGLVQIRGRLFPGIELSSFLGALPPARGGVPQHMLVESGELRMIVPVDRMDIRLLNLSESTPHPGASLHPALDTTVAGEGEEKIELLHLERLRCALERELRFADLC